MVSKIAVLLAVLAQVLAATDCDLNILPTPKTCTMGDQNVTVADPCSIQYKLIDLQKPHQQHFGELISHYQRKTFGCSTANIIHLSGNLQYQSKGFDYAVVVRVDNTTLASSFTSKQEEYRLQAGPTQANISSGNYTGFVRALETFTQLFQCERFRERNGKKACNITNLPIAIVDMPDYQIRGVMIDTARHYLPVQDILLTIDGLMYNKMNVLHWHLTADDSFALVLDSHPDLAEEGAFSPEEVYTKQDIRKIVRYAMVRGVRIIPEVNSPKDTLTWGLANGYNQIVCGTHGEGHLIVKNQSVYKLVQDIFKQIIEIFPDPVLHVGDNDVALCGLGSNLSDQERFTANQQALEQYRRRQLLIIKRLGPSKTIMFRTTNQAHKADDEHIVQWTSRQVVSTAKQVVLSLKGTHELNAGTGSHTGTQSTGEYMPWLEMLSYNPKSEVNDFKSVKGIILMLWSHTSNRYAHHQKIWIRSSSIAQRLWKEMPIPEKTNTLRRVAAHERLMNRRGIPTAPATCQQCEFSPWFC